MNSLFKYSTDSDTSTVQLQASDGTVTGNFTTSFDVELSSTPKFNSAFVAGEFILSFTEVS